MIRIIVCTDRNGLFAYNGVSLKPPPNDLKRFKRLTQGHAVVMGRLTWESLPVKPLPDRINVVVSASDNCYADNDLSDNFDAYSVADAIEGVNYRWPDKHIYIIGGQHIYNEALPLADQIARTVINDIVPEDVILHNPRYFRIPEKGWKLTSVEKHDNYDFEVWERC